MKINKFYTLVFLLFSVMMTNKSIGQTQLPNSGFEIWETKTFNGTNYEDPQGWFTLNQLKAFGFDETTFESSLAKVGSKAAILETMLGPSTTIPGLLTVQNIIGINGFPDIEKNRVAFNGRPNSIEFWYQSFPEPKDANIVFMLLTKWVDGKRDTIGFASFEIDSIVASYTEANVPFEYVSGLTPDSMSFIASSSKDGFSPIAGSLFMLDDLRLTYSNAIREHEQNRLTFFPNPCTETIFVTGLKEEVNYTIYDLTGNLLKEGVTLASKVYGLNQLASGNYILKLSSKQSSSFHRIIINN
jgi:hypothetical protein